MPTDIPPWVHVHLDAYHHRMQILREEGLPGMPLILTSSSVSLPFTPGEWMRPRKPDNDNGNRFKH